MLPAVSVIIPALNAGAVLPRTLEALIPGMVEGLLKEVIIVDGGSSDATPAIVEAAGARLVESPAGRGRQLGTGAAAARAPWLLFLHADGYPCAGWTEEVRAFLAGGIAGGRAKVRAEDRVGVFRFALDDPGPAARRLERAVAWRCALLGLPYGDQGLLIHRSLYDRLGGFRPLPLMEDVDLIRRIGRRRIVLLRTAMVTSAARYRAEGYTRRSLRNLGILALYGLGVSPDRLARLYGYR